MAYIVIKRNQRRFIITIISLSLGFILMNSVYTISHSFDIDKYLEGKIACDFYLSDSTLINSFYNKNNHTISNDLLTKVEGVKGFQKLGNIYYRETEIDLTRKAKQRITEFYQQKEVYKQVATSQIWIDAFQRMRDTGKMGAIIYGEDDLVIQKQDIYYGEFDINKFKTGNYILVAGIQPFSKDDEDKENIGEKVVVDGKEYEVMAYVDILSLSQVNGTKTQPALRNTYIIPSDNFLKEYSKNTPILTYLDFDKKGIRDAQKFLDQYKADVEPNLIIESKSDYVEAYQSETIAQNIMGQTLSIVIILIGLINFINTLLISMISRRKDFALMQSIGMTKGQLTATLIYEGIYYAIFTIIITVPIAAGSSLFFIKKYIESGWTRTYHFTLTPIFICAVLLVILAIILPNLFLNNNKKLSLLQRLRIVE